MDWYHVIKTINGRRYVYRQITWRADGSVKTRSEYLGPADKAASPSRNKNAAQISRRPEEKSRKTSRGPRLSRKTS